MKNNRSHLVDRGAYLPKGAELRARLLAVQATWTPEIELSRRAYQPVAAEIQQIGMGELVGAVRMSEREMAEL